MRSADGRFVGALDGEIYNFRSLRGELEQAGERFRGDSDTEVLLAAVCRWGLETAVRRSIGMFALALVDLHDHCLHLARDRFGEKPLYFFQTKGAFLFGSELKALRACPWWSRP